MLNDSYQLECRNWRGINEESNKDKIKGLEKEDENCLKQEGSSAQIICRVC
jgi:hypothetical protein